MAYATINDITNLYGPDALFVADHDGDGTVNASAVDQALALASSEIDSYLAAREVLPLAGTHPLLTQLCVDITLYRLALADRSATDEHRTRYEDALATLRRLSRGEQRLAIEATGGEDINGDGDPDSSPQPVVSEGPERLFTRANQRDL